MASFPVMKHVLTAYKGGKKKITLQRKFVLDYMHNVFKQYGSSV